ncbi:MAG: hypothetical protein ACFE8E_13015 [Candidatus Hodarchaeota archaeon]
MITKQALNKKKPTNIIQCVICCHDTKRQTKIVNLENKFVVICWNCHEKFTHKELELMNNLFIAFGGYFGKLKTSKSSRYKVIKELIREFNIQSKDTTETELNVKVLYRALLFGITPSQLVQGIKLLNE